MRKYGIFYVEMFNEIFRKCLHIQLNIPRCNAIMPSLNIPLALRPGMGLLPHFVKYPMVTSPLFSLPSRPFCLTEAGLGALLEAILKGCYINLMKLLLYIIIGIRIFPPGLFPRMKSSI